MGAQIVVKLLAIVIGTVCYVLMIFFHSALFNTYEKLIICAVFSGFLVLYIAFGLSVFLNREIDSDLNSAWALYGAAAYIGVGALCIITFYGRSDSESILGLIGGIVSLVQAIVLTTDVIVLQNED